MVFVRKWKKLPADPFFPADLEKLGYGINDKGQIVNSKTGKFYQLFISDNERVNEVHKEATHECVREVLKQELAGLNVKEYHLHGIDGARVEEPKPPNDHAKIYATDLCSLKLKSDVVVIVPERGQDLGIWSYRHVLTDGGIVDGSALGLVEKLQKINFRGEEDVTWDERRAVYVTKRDDAAHAMGKLPHKQWPDGFKEYVRISEEGTKGLTKEEIESGVVIPGVVILNPGQIMYSWELKKPVTVNTWNAQPKIHAVDDQFETRLDFDYKPGSRRDVNETIDKDGSFMRRLDWSKVPGHGTAQEHVDTVLERVLPQLVSNNARIWVVGVSDGAELLVNYMDGKSRDPSRETMVVPNKQVKAVALVNSTHSHGHIQSDRCKQKLKARGKSWILSDQPLGTELAVPKDLTALRDLDQQEERKPKSFILFDDSIPTFNCEEVGNQRRRFAQVDSLQSILKHEEKCGRVRSSRVPMTPSLNPFIARSPSIGGSDYSPKAAGQSPRRFEHIREPATRSRAKTSPVEGVFAMDDEEWREVKSQPSFESPKEQHLQAGQKLRGGESSGEDDFAISSEHGDDVEESALMKEGDYDNDEGLWMKGSRRTRSQEAGDELGEGEAVDATSPEAEEESGDVGGVVVDEGWEGVEESDSVAILPDPDMLTVSGGVSGDGEVMWPVAMDDILAWFVEMGKGGS